MNKKVLSLLLVFVMVFASVATLASCTQDPAGNDGTVEYVDPYKDITDPDDLYAAIYGVLGSLASVVGDLAFSVVKRQTGIKDYGNLIPGHGGIHQPDEALVIDDYMQAMKIYILSTIAFDKTINNK